MASLSGRRIVLGVTGSIAAYKSAFVVRELVKAGAQVRVVMTPGAKEFIAPLTFGTLSGHAVHSELTDDRNAGTWTDHVELGLWGDVVLVAPATAHTISGMVEGRGDSLLLTVLLSAKCPVVIAPAMDRDMFTHPATTENLDTLTQRGVHIIEPGTGELASGLTGKGRMAEPEAIVSHIESHILKELSLYGKTILVTAGPTYEAIDPVRFIGNHSSGLMGFEIANKAAQLGAKVIYITGPTHYSTNHSRITTIPVISALEMYTQVHAHFQSVDVAILSAAVADYKPINVATSKIKKAESTLSLELEKTKDILASLGKIKSHQILVGFALETNDEVANAIKKLKSKNLDLIVLNSLNDKGAGFGGTSNKVTLIDKNLVQTAFPLKSKADVATDIMNELLKQINA